MTRAMLLLAAALALCCPTQGWTQEAQLRSLSPDRPDQRKPLARTHERPTPVPEQPRQARDIRPFVLTAVRMEGATAPPAAIDVATRPFIGKTIDRTGLQAITDALAEAYERHTDIALYTIVTPEQAFEGGVLRLRVLEGYVQDVTVHGAGKRDMALLRAYARRLAQQRPLRRSSLQRYVSLMRDISGLNPELQLVAGRSPGAVRLQIEVKPQPVQVGLSINNRGTAFLGRTQVQGDLILNGLLRQGDQTRLTVALPTETRLFQYYTLSHSQPIGADGAEISVSAGYLRTRPQGFDLTGHAGTVGVQASYPLKRNYSGSLYLTGGLDGLNADNALLGETFSSDHTRAARFGVSFNRSSGASEVSASVTGSFGLRILGARVTDPTFTDVAFRKVNLKVVYNRRLTPRLVLRLDGAAQASGDRLPASEQMALGGDEFGRAYEASIVTGDYGYAGSAELAWQPANLPAAVRSSEAYVFADGGRLWTRDRPGLAGQVAPVASAGGGVRIAVLRRAILQLEAARGLTDPAPSLPRQRWRGIVSLRTFF